MLIQPPPAEPSIAVGKIALEYAGFLSTYALLGAAGFWIAVARPLLATAEGADAPMARAARTGALVGLIGALLAVPVLVAGLLQRAAERHTSVAAAFAAGRSPAVIQVVLLAVLVVAFALLARGRSRALWPLAAAAVIALTLRNVVLARWPVLVNPLHLLGGGLWLGTLFVLVVAVLPLAVRGELAPRGSGPPLAAVVARFSRLALVAASVLALSGVVTAWRHLKYVSALWTTPYGYALMAKLAVVGVVVALGAWNWKRVSPRLGDDAGGAALARSSRAELGVAAVVLALSALLVSLPAPRLPGAAGRPAGGPAPAGAPGVPKAP